nr:hypothetical protein [uncultured bacterium]
MKMKLLLIIVVIGLVSCSSDEEKASDILISVTNSQNWDGENITVSDLGTTEFIDENGEILKIERLRYLISKVILTNSYGDEIEIGTYKLVDLADNNTLNYATNIVIPPGTYTGISFVYGFNEEDNIDQAYPDLNTASWSWPEMLGGGYHFMQLDGTFTSPTNISPLPFNYHNGTARISEGVFEQNFIRVNVDELSIDSNTNIDIKMNLAEWFKNPKTWDLNLLNTGLMGNYDAQIKMNENGQSVFSVYLGD